MSLRTGLVHSPFIILRRASLSLFLLRGRLSLSLYREKKQKLRASTNSLGGIATLLLQMKDHVPSHRYARMHVYSYKSWRAQDGWHSCELHTSGWVSRKVYSLFPSGRTKMLSMQYVWMVVEVWCGTTRKFMLWTRMRILFDCVRAQGRRRRRRRRRLKALSWTDLLLHRSMTRKNKLAVEAVL